MQQFILNIILFLTLAFGLNLLCYSFLPENWECPQFIEKKVEWDSLQPTANTFFIGSSRTFRHIDPVVFDSVNAAHGIHTFSFNFGISSLYVNERDMILNKLFKDPHSTDSLDYLFIELDDKVRINDDILYTPRTTWYVTPSTIGKIITSIAESNFRFGVKSEVFFEYFNSLLAGELHIGQGAQVMVFMAELVGSSRIKDQPHRGFSPIDSRLPGYPGTENWQERHTLLLADTSVIHRNYEKLKKMYRNSTHSDRYNAALLKTSLEMIDKMGDRGVDVIYFIPVRGTLNRSLANLYAALPAAHRINLKTAPGADSLHVVKYWFDPGHLNIEGAHLATTMLAHEFELLETKQDKDSIR